MELLKKIIMFMVPISFNFVVKTCFCGSVVDMSLSGLKGKSL